MKYFVTYKEASYPKTWNYSDEPVWESSFREFNNLKDAEDLINGIINQTQHFKDINLSVAVVM